MVDIPTLYEPQNITLSPDGTYAYTTHYRNAISVIDLAALKTVSILSTGIQPTDVAVAVPVFTSLTAISKTPTDLSQLVYDPQSKT